MTSQLQTTLRPGIAVKARNRTSTDLELVKFRPQNRLPALCLSTMPRGERLARLEQIKAIQIHHLAPGGDEIAHEALAAPCLTVSTLAAHAGSEAPPNVVDTLFGCQFEETLTCVRLPVCRV